MFRTVYLGDYRPLKFLITNRCPIHASGRIAAIREGGVRRVLIILISAVTGVCFAALAGLSISEILFPVRGFHVMSVIVAVFSVIFGYLAFRAAIFGKTNAEALAISLHGGVIGAIIGLFAIILLIVMFQHDLQAYLAHSLGKRASILSEYRLLVIFVLLGFGVGFVARVPSSRNSRHLSAEQGH